MDLHSALEVLKSEDQKPELLMSYNAKIIMKGIAAWPDCFENFNEVQEKKEGDSDFDWLWKACTFNLDKFCLMVGTRAIDLILKLARARMIYPDGTYSEGLMQYFINLNRSEKTNAK